MLGVFVKFQNATISFIMCVCVHPPIHPRGITQLPPDGFSWNLIFENFLKICCENSSFVKIWQEHWVICIKTNTVLIICCSVLLRTRNVTDKSCRENQNTYFMFSNFFFENCAIYRVMWKNIVELGRPKTMWCTHTLQVG